MSNPNWPPAPPPGPGPGSGPTPPYGGPGAPGGYGGGYGAPGGYGGGYGGPPPAPKKGRGGLIALGVVGVLVLAAIAVGAFFLAKGSSNDTASPAPTTNSATSSASTSTSPAPTSPTTSATSSSPTTAPTTDANTVSGTDYQYELPSSSWTDLSSSEVAKLGASIDSGIVLGTSLEASTANILVERGSAPGLTLDALEPTWESNIEKSVGSTAHKIPATTVDGEPADAIRIKSTQAGGVQVQQVAYLMLHGGDYYSVAVSYRATDDRTAELDFADVLRSWAWTN